jgi:hypothetical protein
LSAFSKVFLICIAGVGQACDSAGSPSGSSYPVQQSKMVLLVLF